MMTLLHFENCPLSSTAVVYKSASFPCPCQHLWLSVTCILASYRCYMVASFVFVSNSHLKISVSVPNYFRFLNFMWWRKNTTFTILAINSVHFGRISPFTMVCSHQHHPSPERVHYSKWKLCPSDSSSRSPSPTPVTPTPCFLPGYEN
jgi:hypothetical protein